MSDDVVLIEVSDDVAVLTLNRPERLNAWTPALQTRLFDLLDECTGRDDVRAIVVTGAGRGFCAGADMQVLAGLTGDGSGNGATAGGARTDGSEAIVGQADGRPVRHFLSVPKPVIAAINGPCAGIGLALALMCDIRFAAEEAKITTAFAKRGLVAEHGVSWMLARLVGPAAALDLLLSGRVVRGREAAQMGLVNRALSADVVLGDAVAYATAMARECSPASMATMKAQMYADLERPLAAAVDDANRLMGESFGRSDFAEGVQSYLEKRAPRFAPVTG
jgi:enoyl-CoA hydratase/carnithine racemase